MVTKILSHPRQVRSDLDPKLIDDVCRPDARTHQHARTAVHTRSEDNSSGLDDGSVVHPDTRGPLSLEDHIHSD